MRGTGGSPFGRLRTLTTNGIRMLTADGVGFALFAPIGSTGFLLSQE